LFGPSYSGAVLPFQISIGLFWLSGMGSAFGTIVLATGDARTPTVGLTIGTAISVGFSFLLIPRYGAVGAAVAACIGEIISCAYTIPKFLRITRPRIGGRLIKMGAGSLAGVAGFYLLRPFGIVPPGMNLTLAVVLTVAGLYCAREISPQHLLALRQLLRKPATDS
jgi:O-antigen/teichoic acid export membrane protein